MTNYRPRELVAFVGTMAIFTGAVILVASTATSTNSGATYFFGSLFVISGLLLRIEAAILRAGDYAPPPVEPSPRPWRREAESSSDGTPDSNPM